MFEPGSGSQAHDFNGGIHPNGLFWTVAIPPGSFSLNLAQGRGRFQVRGVPLVESFVFGGANIVPAIVNVDVRWDAVEAPADLGLGTSVPLDDPGAFLGRFARARAVGSFAGSTLGFTFRSRPDASSDQGFAEIGTEQNGVFLT